MTYPDIAKKCQHGTKKTSQLLIAHDTNEDTDTIDTSTDINFLFFEGILQQKLSCNCKNVVDMFSFPVPLRKLSPDLSSALLN